MGRDSKTSNMRGAVTIRRSRPDDFESWVSLFEEVAAEGRWIGAEAPLDRDWARRSFDQRVDAGDSVTLLAEVDGLLVGHLFVTLTGGCADLGMMVRESYRGQGVGTALMDACLEWCRDKNAYKVTLMRGCRSIHRTVRRANGRQSLRGRGRRV